MKVGIFIAYFYCLILSFFYKVWFAGRRHKNLAIYLHSPKFSDGYFRRFLIFNEQFVKNKIDFKIFTLIDET